jgi:Domain of unknown function (DUF4112)
MARNVLLHGPCERIIMARAISPYSGPQFSADALTPEVVDPRIADVEALARWLDYAFVLPGGFRYGLSGIIGLIPGIGDILDAILSLYIVARAVQLGLPRITVTRMVLNVGIEATGGALPFLGAMFDTVFKANRRNYQLLRSHLYTPRRQTTKDWLFVILAAVLLLASIAIPIILLWELAKRL